MLQKMEVSGVSPAAGLKSGQFVREKNSKKENIEFRIMNIECRRNEFCLFKKTERSETTLQNSAVRYSLFCGSLFRPREVSFKVSGVREKRC